MVKGGSRSRFTKNKTVFSQFTKNKIGISRFTEKRRMFSLNKSCLLLHFEKLRPKQSLPSCCHFPFTSRFARFKNTSPLICISLNKNTNYCDIPHSSKDTDTCNGCAGAFCNRSETEFRVLYITNGTIFLQRKIISVIVGRVVIVFGELIVSWVPRCRCAFCSRFL